MSNLKSIQDKINVIRIHYLVPKMIIINPETERQIFTEGELAKSESLEEHFKLPVILNKEVKIYDIIIGI